MKAVVQDRYGLDALRLADVERPEPKAGEVLIRVCAASANAADVAFASGVPALTRLAAGMRRPKVRARGVDFAGVVEAIGPGVMSLRPGDEVYGQGVGTFAEFAVAPETQVVAKPANASFEEAAAVPMVGLVALQALRDKGKIGPGSKVLVVGAGGGIGSFAVQLAKSFGAQVTAVCGPSKVELVRSLGAGRVVDYTREDFTATLVDAGFDLILDNVSNRPLRSLRRLLGPKGILIMNGGEFGHRIMGPMGRFARGALMSVGRSRKLVNFLSRPYHADLVALMELIEAGKVRPVVTRTCSLAEVPAAIAEVAAGHAAGKIVVRIAG